mmetsp:Transcript_23325/g.55555  ORF Transcript_23325/g.55555 Transcript_23325/m.55555 type:complete len:204 (-) Transcript_23325:39-650(-)
MPSDLVGEDKGEGDCAVDVSTRVVPDRKRQHHDGHAKAERHCLPRLAVRRSIRAGNAAARDHEERHCEKLCRCCLHIQRQKLVLVLDETSDGTLESPMEMKPWHIRVGLDDCMCFLLDLMGDFRVLFFFFHNRRGGFIDRPFHRFDRRLGCWVGYSLCWLDMWGRDCSERKLHRVVNVADEPSINTPEGGDRVTIWLLHGAMS